MAAEIINLRTARKAKERADRQATAAQNRVRFGRMKADRASEAARTERVGQIWAAHERDQPREAHQTDPAATGGAAAPMGDAASATEREGGA
ncbi:MAG: DUF4169 family protein [Hyphomicrobiaceae bacterium]|nr:DUF4169 family protein [Hyphomicrobiaceae bacterium]